MNNRNLQRVIRCDAAIAAYGNDIEEANLIDFLTDAMHWCVANKHDFHGLLHQAMCHFVAESRDSEGERSES